MQERFFLLVAEDDIDDVFMLKSVLEAEFPAWQHHFVHNGVDLLNYLHETSASVARQPVSLILLDINMPRKNGLDTLLDIRQMAQYQQVPVVGYSTSYDPATIERFNQLGGNHFLEKPETYEELLQLVTFLHDSVAKT